MELTAWTFLMLFLIALIVSFLSSMVGIGGGVLFVPLLVAFFGLSVPEARTISLFCMIFVTLSATIGYFRHKCIDWKLGLVYDLFAVPGIFVGTWVASILDNIFPTLLKVFVVVTLWTLASLILLRKSKFKEDLKQKTVDVSFLDPQHPIKINQPKKWIFALISSFAGGFVAGSVGMGGGTIDTSTMLILGIIPIIAVATSEFAMIFTNTFGFLTSAIFPYLGWNFLNNGASPAPILWEFILPMGIASLIGAFLGTILSRRIKGSVLKKMLAIIVILIGIPILLDIFGLWPF